MRFRILGPIEVRDGDRPVPLGGPQQRAVLAVLLVHAGQVVSIDRLADQLWAQDPPPTARGLIQGCVAGLRRALGTGVAELVTQAPGYMLRPPPGTVDAARFEELADAAEREVSPEPAAKLCREALSLWRGPALDGLAPDACRAESARLAERRMTVLEMRIDAELNLGRAADLVAELRTLVRDHPFRERPWGQLMTALHRSDRRADALEAYRTVRRTLIEGLGVEPGPALRELHRAILGEEHKPIRVRVNGPAQLPAAVSSFSGRDDQLSRLDTMLGIGQPDDGRAMPIAVLCGTAGVGKTALAVQWAHRARDRFTDGQLYVNLRGYSPTDPLRPIEALTGFLHALGVPAEQVPPQVEQAAALYRTLLAERRVLVVLDNARDAHQVRPLLPGGSACGVLITSRDQLGALVAEDGAAHLTLGVLSPAEAEALLSRVLGPGPSLTELARLCAYLPLALRIAAAHLTLSPHRSVAAYLDRLAAGGLDALTAGGDSTVRAAFDLSYQDLPEAARELFRRLGLAPGTDVSAGAAAALGDLEPAAAQDLLHRLTVAHLVEEHRPGRYTLHDLLRLYAASHNAADERDAALTRLYSRYLDQARSAAALLYPHMLLLPYSPPASTGHADSGAALAWLDADRDNLVLAVEAAARSGPRRLGWLLADALRGAFHLSRHVAGWLTIAEAALAAATAEGDRPGQAAARHSLGTAHRSVGEFDEALRHYTEGLRLTRECGWAEAQATTLGNLGIVCRKLGRLSEAVAHLETALEVDRLIGRRSGEANNLGNLAAVLHEQGRLAEAAEAYRAAMALNAEGGVVHGQALARTGLGQIRCEQGRLEEARDDLDRAFSLYRQVGDRDGQAVALSVLATVDCLLGRPEAGRETALAALEGAREVADPQTESMALNSLGLADRLLGDPGAAAGRHQAAYELADRTNSRRQAAEALILLAEACHELGRAGEAAGYAHRAQALAGTAGITVVAGRAATTLAVIATATDAA